MRLDDVSDPLREIDRQRDILWPYLAREVVLGNDRELGGIARSVAISTQCIQDGLSEKRMVDIEDAIRKEYEGLRLRLTGCSITRKMRKPPSGEGSVDQS